MAKEQELSKSKELGTKLLQAAFTILKENNRELSYSQILLMIPQRVTLDDWALEQYEKTGNIRWRAILSWFSVGCVKAGFLIKKKGIWYLTPEGEDALKLSKTDLLSLIHQRYTRWKNEARPLTLANDANTELTETEEQIEEITVEAAQQQSLEGIRRFIDAKNPYEFQDLVGALLRGMGYYTPFIAPRGKDGGIDIVAYRDPLGTISPRIKLQIKHRESPANVQEVRQLMGLMQKDGDVGIFVSTGGFTADAKATARSSHIHVELIDLDRFIGLWLEFYDKQTDEDKKLLPLTPIYFVAPAP